MKKTNAAILLLTLLLAFLSYTVTETRVAAISCTDLEGCCGAALCAGPGTVSGCKITCSGGGTATCCSNTSGRCDCGGGLPPKSPPPRPN